MNLSTGKIVPYFKKNPFFSTLLVYIVIFRIFLPVQLGQFGPDESFFALRAHQFFSCTPKPEQMIINKEKNKL